MAIHLQTLAGERSLFVKSEKWPYTCQGLQVEDRRNVKSEKWPFTCQG
jgi:hypothetical protein